MCIYIVCTSFISIFTTNHLKGYKLKPNTHVESRFYKQINLEVTAKKEYKIDFGQEFTSLRIEVTKGKETSILLSELNSEIIIHSSENPQDIEIPEGFVIFRKPSSGVFLTSSESVSLKIELFYAPSISVKQIITRNKIDNCSKPQTISQDEWRKGLPEPISGRKEISVSHCIIHHSAGSNLDTNYTNTVRNIYLLHTQSNGWDDIGYNFLVAPNGDIYSGRDAQGVADEDNIQGAHYCSKNNGTMGICLLGNYNLKNPSTDMVTSLQDLLSWKLFKEELEANQMFPHPTSIDEDLGTIAMHQNGCATECPGDSIVDLIDEIRFSTQKLINECKSSVSNYSYTKYVSRVRVLPNPSNGVFYVRSDKKKFVSYRVLNTLGQEVASDLFFNSDVVSLDLPEGLYILELYDSKKSKTVKSIVIENQ